MAKRKHSTEAFARETGNNYVDFPTTADQYSVCSLSTALIRFFDFFLLRNVENMA